MANQSVDGTDAGPFDQPSVDLVNRATELAHLCPLVPSATNSRRTHGQPVPVATRGERPAPDQRPTPGTPGRASLAVVPRRSTDRCHRFGGRLQWLQKKDTQIYTAQRAAMGQRTFKVGQSRWYVGYKKHTLRLWWRPYNASVLLVPLVSWITPANVFDGVLLLPSLRYCKQHLGWWPRIVVADMSFMGAELKAQCRTQWQVAVVTRLRSDMKLVRPYVAPDRMECHQGQALRWLEYAPEQGQHWFGAAEPVDCCAQCWEASACPRQFAFRASQHETFFGL